MTSKNFRFLLVLSTLLAVLIASVPGVLAAQAADGDLAPNTRFYVPRPNPGARLQIAKLTSSGHKADARLIREMIETPQAV